MVNASLNWASIVGIVLAVCGAGLYFLRSFKPALARDYDVFFAAIGLLCGGILFFQGWRLDPILQFGQFLLAGTTVFFAYESVRLRGVATDQARRSSYFEDEEETPYPPNSGMGRRWGDSYDQFDDIQENPRRRFSSRDESEYDSSEENLYRPRKTSRPAIPEQAASRSARNERDSFNQNSVKARRMARFQSNQDDLDKKSEFGARRTFRQDQRTGSRPSQSRPSERRVNSYRQKSDISSSDDGKSSRSYRGPQGAPISNQPEDAAFSSQTKSNRPKPNSRSADERPNAQRLKRSNREYSNNQRPRDNNSRFDD